jgi:acetyl-CoA carboxylase biotin carboxylase subunit
MFTKVLIANRGEIAVRILRACRGLGLRTVAVYSEADRDSLHVEQADEALCIGPAAPAKSYLNQTALLFAAELSGAQAIHPGYGFLSENAGFAAQVEHAGLTFIGPSSACIRTMGDKVAAKKAMRAAGVPCVPGPDDELPADASAVKAIAREVGYPIIIKSAGGGGGRGMRVVGTEADLLDALTLTREEARRAFGNASVYIEKYLARPRHVEIQVLCDSHGHAVWLGSRDCSLQRRHQKVLEEAPAPGIEPGLIERVGERCVAACRQIGYVGVGTFEFLYEDAEFYFIEMNTRLQVEHPVTEMTSGIDIVQQQLRVARGESLQFDQAAIPCIGHALECRINAEDPRTFAPTPGTIREWRLPGGYGVRVDTHAYAGCRVSPYYDSLIGKLIVHGVSREDALIRMRIALSEMRISGVSSNQSLHRDILDDAEFKSGGVDIHHLERWIAARAKTVGAA